MRAAFLIRRRHIRRLRHKAKRAHELAAELHREARAASMLAHALEDRATQLQAQLETLACPVCGALDRNCHGKVTSACGVLGARTGGAR